MGLGSIVGDIGKAAAGSAAFFTGGATAAAAVLGKDLKSAVALDAAGLAAGFGLSQALAALGAGIGTSLASGEAAIANSTSTAFQGITDTLSEIKDTIGPTFQVVGDTLHSITSTIKDINEGIIKPIVGPINAAMDTFSTLKKVIQEDLHGGLQGLMRLPGDVTNSLTSLDATVQRSISMLGAQHADTINAHLVPALVGKDGRSLGDLNATMQSILAPATGTFSAPPKFDLSTGEGLDAYKAWAAEQQKLLFEEASLPALIFQWFFKLVGVVEGLAAQREPFVELWREEIQREAGIKRFSEGTVDALLKRGELDQQTARDELRALGYHTTRAEALVQAARVLPDTQRILQWFARRWVDNQVATAMLIAQGWNAEDVPLLLDSSQTELDFGILVELVRRKQLTREEAQAALERQGFRQFDSDKALAMIDQLLGAQDLIQLQDRAHVSSSGIGFSALSSQAPEELREQLALLGVPAANADVLWANHWRLLTPELAVMAYFRGYINQPQLEQALASASLPPELWQTYIDLQRPVIPTRSITTLLAHGVINQSTALDILQKRGFTLVDAQRIVDLEAKANAPSVAAQADHAHTLTQGVILQLYDSHTIGDEEATGLLKSLGWADDTIHATLQVHQVRAAAQERASDIELVIARAKAGLYDYETAQGQLAQLGLSTTETNKALARLTTQLNQHTKMPSESQVLAMLKHGVMDEATTADALRLLGYSPVWVERLINLEQASAARPPKP